MATSGACAKHSSEVWKYFKKNKKGDKAQCSVCLKWLKVTGNTTNFMQHLNRHGKLLRHKRSHEEIDKLEDQAEVDNYQNGLNRLSSACSSTSLSTQSTINECFNRLSDFTAVSICLCLGGRKAEAITKALTLWLVKDNRPVDILSGEGFKKFLATVATRYQVPHRTTITKHIDSYYEAAVKYMWNKFANIKFCALTYFKHTSYVLGMTYLTQSHTAEYLCSVLKELIVFWEIDKSNIVACVTDNAANVKKSIELFIGKEKHVSCFAHTLNLMVQGSLRQEPELNIILDKVKSIITFFNQNKNATQELEKERLRTNSSQNEKGSVTLKLIQHVETRWNSYFLMIERFVLLKNFVTLTLQKFPGAPDMLSGRELSAL
ncbi:zinc finger BED domain-containing protein 1-like, partial [Centruroides sculpturatus]|uniref:zinc finger BED domain-containing protein 1-like n=1 Tax=Centruroides sculpturatus TaxID=218467 RepID=UPI000C6C9383